jgi:hypothetical protein
LTKVFFCGINIGTFLFRCIVKTKILLILLISVLAVIAVSCGDSSELTKKKDLNNFDPEKTPLLSGKQTRVTTIKSVTFFEFENPDLVEIQFNRRIIVSPDTLMTWINVNGIDGHRVSEGKIFLSKKEDAKWSDLKPKIVAIVEKQIRE